MYVWCLKEGIAAGNPVINTHKRAERGRDRVLSDKEMTLIWQALPDGNCGDIVKLLILTGQRANEIAQLKWAEVNAGQIDLPRGGDGLEQTLTVPERHTKLLKVQLGKLG
jgi:integrase